MTETIAVTKAITKYSDVEALFNLSRAGNAQFFAEWSGALPEISEAQAKELDSLKRRFLTYLEEGEISEGTVNMILLSPLLNLLGLCDPPYRVRGERSVRIELATEDETGAVILEGRIDALTVRGELWLVVIEGKRGGFSVLQAVPQALAYMMASPRSQSPIFGLVTNGEDYIFAKVDRAVGLYGLSRKWTIATDGNELYDVARILKGLVA
jgi:hypothetical protein